MSTRIQFSQSESFQSEYHGGPCCSGCIGEIEEGYPGGGDLCCCHDGKTPLENPDYDPKYPPVNGKLPEIFEKWGPKTQKRYLARYKKELINEYIQEN